MQIKIIEPNEKNSEIIAKCEKLAYSWHISQGGPLFFLDVVRTCDKIVLVVEGENLIGFLGLKKYAFLGEKSIYIEQLAVDKVFLNQGIATKLLNEACVFARSTGNTQIIANVQIDNTPSISLFEKNRFLRYEMAEDIYLALGFQKTLIQKEIAFYFSLV